MTDPLVRRAGSGRREDGALVTWTVAEGRRGRRWREVVSRDGAVLHSLLYETGPDRRFTHLELASPAGLATLHPEGDGTLHGNVAGWDGVAHLVGVPFADDGIVAVHDSIVAAAAIAWSRLGPSGVVLDPTTLRLTARDGSANAGASFQVDADGVPVLPGGRSWPLELEGDET